MKTRIIFIALAVFGFLAVAQAQQQDNTPAVVLKINPFFLFGRHQVYAEIPVSQSGAVQFSAATFNGLAIPLSNYDNVFSEKKELSHWLLLPEYRHYLNGQVLQGTYIGLYGRTKFSAGAVDVEYEGTGTERNFDHHRSVTELGGGFLIGKQWLTKSGITIDLFIGSGRSYRWVNNRYDDKTITDDIYEEEVLGHDNKLDGWRYQLRLGGNIGFQLGKKKNGKH
jgi:hypothetical protein